MQTRDVMTREVVTVGPAKSGKGAAAVMAGPGFAALPVVDDDGRLAGIVNEADVLRDSAPEDPLLHPRRGVDDSSPVGIVTRRDLLQVLVRPDDDIREDLHLLVEADTGEPGGFEVIVVEGMARIRRTWGDPEVSKAVEGFALQRLASRVPGIVAAEVVGATGAWPASSSAAGAAASREDAS